MKAALRSVTMAVIFYIYQALLISAFVVLQTQSTNVTVVSKVGTLIGIKTEVAIEGKNMNISKFLGIPYAEPPTGNNRFKVPVPKSPFQEPRVVQDYGNICFQVSLQFIDVGSEDCLFLNVFVPDKNVTAPLAVMVYIHGGSFKEGSSDDYTADVFATLNHIIVVTINYRLSAWGFLSTEDSNSLGNYGLWDQHMAIKWVHDNIEEFGGDRDRITIFGESAGAASVIYQGLYPGNKGLFRRMIAQSGSAAAHWAYTTNQKNDAADLAAAVSCTTNNTEDMLDCLRGLSADVINSNLNYISNSLFRTTPMFLPSVDNVFVTCEPSDIFNTDTNTTSFDLSRDMFSSVDILMGINSGEGGLFLNALFKVDGDHEMFLPNKTYFDTVLVPHCVNMVFGKKLNETARKDVTDLVITEYTDESKPESPYRIREQFALMYSDAYFLAPLHTTVAAHIAFSKEDTYVYYLNVLPSFHLLPMPSWYKRANHADDLIYLFPFTFPLGFPMDAEETEVSRHMMGMWSNFAKTGNPNQPSDFGINWQPYTETNHRYLKITRGMASSNVKEKLSEKKAEFWNRLASDFVRQVNDECEYHGITSGTLKVSQSFTESVVVVVLAWIFCHM